jgi:hypothetical protein
MVKNNHFIFIKVIAILFFTFSGQLISQPIDENKKLEERIKISKEYYYSQDISKEINEAKIISEEVLISQIFDSEIKMKVFNENKEKFKSKINYLIFPRGANHRVICYITKKDADVFLSPNLIINNSIQNNYPEKKNNESINNISNEIISSITKKETLLETLNYLNEKKMQGKLVYSLDKSAFADFKKCYVLIYDPNKKIKETVLSDEIEGSRTDYKNSNKVINCEQEFNNFKLIYIYLINN